MPRITIKIDLRLAKHVLKQLIKKGFDAANVAEMVPVGKYGDRGVSHMLARPMPKLVPKLDIPVIPIFLNQVFRRCPTASGAGSRRRAAGNLRRHPRAHCHLPAAGACRRPATVIDDFASHYAKTGCAFAYWPPEKAPRAKRKASLAAAAH